MKTYTYRLPHTFGKTKADLIIVEILNDLKDQILAKYVGNVFRELGHKIKCLNKIEEPNERKFFIVILHQYFIDKVKNSKLICKHTSLESHILNSIQAKKRQAVLKTIK